MPEEDGLTTVLMPEAGAGEERSASGTERQKNRASTLRTAVNLTKCFVGAASFELPWAFAQAGVVGGTVGVLFLAVLSTFSLQKLAHCSSLTMDRWQPTKQRRAPTYPDVGREALGTVGSFLAWFGVVAMSLGVCGSYLVFICNALAQLTLWETQTVWVLIILPLIIILSWVRYVATFAWTSSFGVLALVAAVIVATIDAAQHGKNVTIDWDGSDLGSNSSMSLLRIDTYPLFLGNAGYLYLISTCILPVAQSMAKPKEFGRAFVPSVIFVTVVNIAFGLYTAVRYGGHVCPDHYNETNTTLINCVEPNVLSNMLPGIAEKVVKWLLVIDLVFTTIVFLFPINEAIEQALLKRLPHPKPGFSNFWLSRRTWAVNGLRALVAVGIAAVALGVPFFSLLTGLTGGFGNNILGFILPPMFYYKLRGSEYWKDPEHRCSRVCEGAGLVLSFIFGLVFLVLTLYFFSIAIVSGSS